MATSIMRRAPGSAEQKGVQSTHFVRFLVCISVLVFCFAVLETVAFLVSQDSDKAITGATLFGYGIALVTARSLVLKSRLSLAVYILCFGHLAATLLVIPVRPDLAPALVVSPFLPVGIALPYTSKKVLRLLLVSAWVVAVIAAIYGGTSSLGSEAFSTYENAFRISAFAVTFAVVLFLLWQFRNQLINMLSQVKVAEERYALAERGTNDVLWDWDLSADRFYLSPRWKEMVGCVDDQIGSKPEEWFGRIHPEDRKGFEAHIESALQGSQDSFEQEYRVLHSSGEYLWVLNRGLIVRDKSGRATRMVGAQTDITRRKHIEKQLLYQATHDPLTGLPGQASLKERLSEAIERARQDEAYLFAVLFLDLDWFKNVNDSLGHKTGDELLVAVANRLKNSLRATDTLARLGGDEFVILLDDIDDDEHAQWIAYRLQRDLAIPFRLQEHELFTTASIGIVQRPARYEQPEDLLRDADIAMYKAKDMGKARHEVFEVTMHNKIVSRLHLETDLRRAIEKQEFLVHYQPIISLGTGRIVAFEALVRWHHPTRGMVSPGDFIPLAEETGLIVPVGNIVLREACRQMRSWQDRYPEYLPLTVDVNLSGVQLTQSDLISVLNNVLHETDVDGKRLRLEITESAIARDANLAIRTLYELRGLDVQTHIDDFGTGYSSLGALHRFPMQGLKIDRSFVGRMGAKDDNTEIVQTIVSLAHNLGMDVVAEGVETPAQLAQLRRMGCDYAQGYFFSKPVDGERAEEMLSADPRW